MFFHLGKTRFVTKNHRLFKNVTLFCRFFDHFDKNTPTVQHSKCVILVILVLFDDECPFPTRELKLLTTVRCGIEDPDSKMGTRQMSDVSGGSLAICHVTLHEEEREVSCF